MKDRDTQTFHITTASWVRGIIVIAIAAAVFQLRDLFLAIIAAIVIASAIEPAAVWAKRNGLPRIIAVISMYILTAVSLAALFYFLLIPLLGEVSGFIKTLTIYSNASVEGGALFDMFERQNIFGGLGNALSISELNTHLNSLTQFLSQGALSTLSVVFGGVFSFILIVVVSFYLSVQEDGVGKFLKVVTPYNKEKYVVGLWKRTQIKIGRWMQGQLILGAIIMVMVYIGLLILGVENALLLAFLAGAFELIPLVGPILAAIPAMLIGFAGGGMTDLLLVAGLYLIIQQLENHVIYPMVVKKMVGVPPIVSILALVIGGTLAGFLGVLIAVPLATIVIELLSDFEAEKSHKIAIAEGKS